MNGAAPGVSGNFIDLTGVVDHDTVTAALGALLADTGKVLAIGVGTDEKAVAAKAVVKAKVDDLRGTCRAAWLQALDAFDPVEAAAWFPRGGGVVFLKRNARTVVVRLSLACACDANEVDMAFGDASAR